MSTEIVVHENALTMMPVMDIATALARRQSMVQFVQSIMKQGTDFGTIPGTDKPTLLKPGAEKLTTFFGLRPRFVEIRTVEDWTGGEYGGEPFFYYRFTCQLWRGDTLIAEADGACNSMESRYRYRNASRKCPACGKEAIIKGKQEYGGGWICFKKQGGCGAKYADEDKKITEQQVGRVFNPDIADQANTILKMSQKRALVAATLIGVNASEFFTQDMEDYVEGEVVETPPAPGNGNDSEHTDKTSSQKKPFGFSTHAQTIAWTEQHAPLAFDHQDHIKNAYKKLAAESGFNEKPRKINQKQLGELWTLDVNRRVTERETLIATLQEKLPDAEELAAYIEVSTEGKEKDVHALRPAQLERALKGLNEFASTPASGMANEDLPF